MATDTEQLILSISADVRQIQRALQRMQTDTASATRNVQRHFDTMGRNVERSLARSFRRLPGMVRGGLAAIGIGFSVREAQQLIDAATRVQNALKVAGLEGENLDRVYRRLFESAQKNAAPIETLVALYSRASLVQKELGISSEQLLGFTDKVAVALRVAGTDAQSASGALLQLSQALGSGTVRAEEFNSILEGALPIAQAAAAGIEEAGGSVAKLRQLVVDGKISSEAFFRGFEAGAVLLEQKVAGAQLTVGQSLTILGNALQDSAGEFDKATGASARFAGGITNISEAINSFDMTGFIAEIQRGVAAMEGFFARLGNSDVFKRFNEYFGITSEENLAAYGMTPIDYATDRVQSASGSVVAGGKTSRLPQAVNPIRAADYAPSAKDKKSDGAKAPRKSAADRFNDDIQSIRDRTAALKEEQATLRLSFEEQERRKISLELEQQALADLREEARRKGEKDLEAIQLSADQRKAIDEVAAAYARQAEELRKANELFELERDVLEGIFGDLRSALDDGKLEWQEFANVALNALDKVIDKILDDLISAIMEASDSAGGLKGILGSLLGGIFGGGVNLPSTAPIPTPAPRANGGPVRAGMPYVVGERRPELFVPNQNGMILPRVPSGNASSVFSPSFSIDARGAQPGVGAEIQTAIKQAMDQMRREFPMNTAKALKTIKVMGYQ